ncbi:DUF4983 domain-containing protein [Niabella ginsengisoli]|uniref:DUF4983 domain-containing protein n=1 Tax=Niabella ginsengisoli TaxID=522298 RepID=A0ABS9SG20_9BACT|nr:DUF4983 domain-containing protein [Niabella ginsengisoli]MCH5597301.1 DUF4983 domain-containing protein [Niabella ginsengisoli]
MYSDGVRANQLDITTWGPITSPEPLTIGWGRGDVIASHMQFNVADVRVFNTALTGAEIVQNLCITDIKQHSKYSALTGYWPCNDGFGGSFKNYAPGAVNKDFLLTTGFSWANVASNPCTFPAINDPNRRTLLLTSSSVAATAFYWLRVPVSESWGFEGSKWLADYDKEFIEF